MDQQRIFKIIPLAFLILGIGLIISHQVSYRRDLIAQEEIYKQFQRDEAIRLEKLRKKALKDYLTGHFNPAERKDFGMVPRSLGISGYDMYLRKETLEAFEEMAQAAEKDGVKLRLASATRNFDYQKMIWNNKWLGYTYVEGQNLSLTTPNSQDRFNKILEYSAVPGTSRHHWGTDIDLNDANPAYFRRSEGIKVYDWLQKNASTFGFCQPYNEKGPSRSTGYNEEKWHWSYIPLAKNFTLQYGTLISSGDINGFRGDENVAKSNLINDYVLGINPECL